MGGGRRVVLMLSLPRRLRRAPHLCSPGRAGPLGSADREHPEIDVRRAEGGCRYAPTEIALSGDAIAGNELRVKTASMTTPQPVTT